MKRSKRTEREFALLLLDLDGLKKINDRHGHLVGSKALCRLADALCICSRDADAASVVARRICDCLANDAKEPRISVSVGVAIYPRNGKTVENLLRMADRALYRIKGERKTAH